MRVSILFVGLLATLLAITADSVYDLWALRLTTPLWDYEAHFFSSDLVYVIIFPQLLLVVHFEEYINARGSQLGFFVGLLVRISGGESKLKIPPLIKYPGYGTDLDYFWTEQKI